MDCCVNHQKGNHGSNNQANEGHHDHHNPDVLLRLGVISSVLTFPVILYTDFIQKWLGFKGLGIPFEKYIPLIFGTIVFWLGGKIFLLGGLDELKNKKPGMMLLISLAITSAFLYSIFGFFTTGKTLFWELTTLIVVMLFGHWMEAISIQRARSALESIAELLPDKAEVLVKGEIKEITLDQLKEGDILIIKPGSKIPADGIVIEGKSEVIEAMITGESAPVLKEKGSKVLAGTINTSGYLKVKVEKVGEATFLSGIKKLIEEAEKSKLKVQLLADRAAFYLTIVAVSSGIISLIYWLVFKGDFAFAIERMVSVLVIACPHALGLAIPLVTVISTSLSASSGFLIRKKLALEKSRKINVVLFDKTGTLTKGEYVVVNVYTKEGYSKEEILKIAGSLENLSEHPVAKAIVKFAQENGIKLTEVNNFQSIPGWGIEGIVNEEKYYIGKQKDPKMKTSFEIKEEDLKTRNLVYLISEKEGVIGAISLEDEIREESLHAVKDLKNMGLKVAMITGDRKEVAENVAKKLGIEIFFSQVLPQDKVEKIKKLQEKGYVVAMVGDGINDAPALAQADIGIAIGAGTNIAIESADIILVRDNPRDVVKVIKLSIAAYSKMVQNLFWGAGYNIFAIPLAAGALYSKGIVLQPAIAAILMSLSTIIVAFNALLLYRFKGHS